LFAPEFQIVDAVVSNAWHNRTRTDLTGNSSNPRRYTANYTNPAGTSETAIINFSMPTEETLAAPNDPAALIRHLDEKLCNGTMTESFKTNLRTAIMAEVNGTSTANARDRLNGAMMTVMNSPFYLIRF
jgi:hypothetical protein